VNDELAKELEGRDRALILKYCPRFRLEELRKTTKSLSQYIWFLVRYLNLGPPEYETGVLTIQSRHSVGTDNIGLMYRMTRCLW
jgi:hypothetical protein